MKTSKHQHISATYEKEFKTLTTHVLAMGEATTIQFRQAIELIISPDVDKLKSIVKADKIIDAKERQIDALATRMIALRQPMANDLRRIIASVKIASDIERFADYAKNIARRSDKIDGVLENVHIMSIKRLAKPVALMFRDIMCAYDKKDGALASNVHSRDKQVDDYYDSLFREMLTYMMEDSRKIASGVQVMFIAKHLERMGDHVTNIAEEVYYQETGKLLEDSQTSEVPKVDDIFD